MLRMFVVFGRIKSLWNLSKIISSSQKKSLDICSHASGIALYNL